MFGEEENQFIIESKEHPEIAISFFHVITKPEIKRGYAVKEGDYLGTISQGNSGEIAVSTNFNKPQEEQLISFFNIISDKVFAEYKARGITNRSELIITKEERDSNPLICNKTEPHRFIGSKEISNDKEAYDKWSMGPDNWVFLT